MKCSNCECREFRPKICKATWTKRGVERRRALGVWSCKMCGYGCAAFHSNITAKTAYVWNQVMRFFRSQQSFATSYKLARSAWWRS